MHTITVMNIQSNCMPVSVSEIINMAISGKSIMYLGALMAVLLVVATEGTVTMYNPARMPLNVMVDDDNIQVETDIMSLDITQPEQKINITTATGASMSVDVKDGDVLVLLPEPPVAIGNITPAVTVVQIPGDYAAYGLVSALPPGFDQSGSDSALPPDFDQYGLDYTEPYLAHPPSMEP